MKRTSSERRKANGCRGLSSTSEISYETEAVERLERSSASTQELEMKCLKSDGSHVCGTGSQPGMDIWLNWLSAVLKLDQNSVFSCSPLSSGKILLLTARDTETQTGHKNVLVVDRELLGCLSSVTDKT